MPKTFIFTLGIPGSGKSTYLADKHPVVSTDELRKELLKNVNDISKEKYIFDTAIKKIMKLFDDYDVVYFDATMVETKHRVAMLETIEDRMPVEFIAVVFPADIELSKQRIEKDLLDGVDRADVVDMLEEYMTYYAETMKLLELGKVKFNVF